MASGQDITITISGLDKTERTLRGAKRAVENLQPAMSEVGTYLARFFSSQVFASRGGIIGEPWQSLSARYAAYKAKRYPGRPPLVRTGLMQRSFISNSGASFARVSNSAPYFDYHQLGGSKVPERVMMKVDETRGREIVGIVERYLAAQIGAA